MDAALPYDDSRRLTGPNLYFATTGAVLETANVTADDELLAAWRARAERACRHLGWVGTQTAARRHRGGASLAVSAPCDRLFTATEVNEWALAASVAERDPARAQALPAAMLAALLDDASDPATVLPPVLEEPAALARLDALQAREAQPALRALLDAASARRLAAVLDDTVLTLGLGVHGRDYALDALPAPDAVPWSELGAIPVALVTGSNGKTTTVRLIAAFLRAQGLRTACTSTDGVYVDDERLASGDYSGPAGARLAVRDRRSEAAVLETARGGILRRGLAVPVADVAVVTNISSDHFGEYGIHDLDALADVKLTVAAPLRPEGRLVLNADDARLVAKAPTLAARFGHAPRLGWFASEADAPRLRDARAAGAPTCGVRDGRLVLETGGVAHDLGAIAAMPATAGGAAAYNVANLAAAALAAEALGVAPGTIARVCAAFGARPRDNLGRLMRYEVGGVHVLVDYAHNPEALRGILGVARRLQGGAGRLGMLIGHAGNRQDHDVAQVARVAAEFRPDLVVVKETESHLRGRAPGEIPRILRATLLDAGVPESAVPVRMTELDAARCALDWARPGDVLALLVHSPAAREAVLALLEAPAASAGSGR